MKPNNRLVGGMYELYTAEYLQAQGYEILEHNFRCKFGEIDLVAEKDGYLVFVEVKYRHDYQYGEPQAAVGYGKQRRISNTASYYIYKNRIPQTQPIRFDVVAVSGDEFRLYENAFDYCGSFSY